MKKLNKIIKICRSGKKPTIDEARFAICVLNSLMVFDTQCFEKDIDVEKKNKKFRDYEERFNRIKNTMNETPKDWLGEAYNPDNPGVQKRQRSTEKLFSLFAKKI